MCYKIVFNIVQLELSEFFARNTYPSTLGHPYKLYVNHNRANIRYHFFACRVVKMWNSLPALLILVLLAAFDSHCVKLILVNF